jgi:transposase
MPLTKPIHLTAAERRALDARVRSRGGRADEARRARVILMLADGEPYESVQEALGCNSGYVARWRRRFEEGRLGGLYARHRGRQRTALTAAMQARILEATRRKPADGSTHWTTRKLAEHLGIPHMRVHRTWASARLKPHRVERYMASDDPDFEKKAADVIGLYLNPPQHAAVFCVDEKSQIQALDRLDPVLPLSPGRAERHGFEYYRHGTLSLFAALEVGTGKVMGHTVDRHTSAEFVAFLEELVSTQPRSRKIHIILDNLSTHKTQGVRDFLKRHPNVKLHYTPTYSSWLNQVEIWFSKIERDVVARGIFTSVEDLARKLLRYIDRYNRKPRRIKWSYSDVSRRIKPAAESTGTLH